MQSGAPRDLCLRLRPAVDLSDEQVYELCRQNDELRIERSAEGDLIVMSPASGPSSRRNARLVQRLANWADLDGRGVVFDSSGGFRLPGGAIRSPDAAWVLRERLAALQAAEKERFLPLAPDFVAELLSPTDSRKAARAKLEEYLAAGTRLGWLLDPDTHEVSVYRPGHDPERVVGVVGQLSAEPELPGFALDLAEIWDPGF